MGKPTLTMTAAHREQAWRDHIARHAKSGKTITAFCRSEGLSEGGFYAWRNRLRANTGYEALTQRPTPAPFIDLGVVQSTTKTEQVSHVALHPNTTTATAGIEIRIDLGGGIVLTVARH